MNINNELVELLKKSGLSDTEFADKVDIHYSQLSRYKTGKSIPRRESIEKIQSKYPSFLKQSKDSQDNTNIEVYVDLIVTQKDLITTQKDLIKEKEKVIMLLEVKSPQHTIKLVNKEILKIFKENIYPQFELDEGRINRIDERIDDIRSELKLIPNLIKKTIKESIKANV